MFREIPCAYKKLTGTAQVNQSRITVIIMKSLFVLTALSLFVNLSYNKAAKIEKRMSLSRVSRQELPSCGEQICKDCRGSCDGCNKCPLCEILAKTCAEGKKKLVFEGDNVCAKCKYCKDGKENCKRNCETGKLKATCQHCINNCPNEVEK